MRSTQNVIPTQICLLQFISTLEANILAKLNAIVDVTVDKVTAGSVMVANTVAFTDANSASATAAQDNLATVLNSGDVSSIFGDSFGPVTVTNVAPTTSSNPSKLFIYVLNCCMRKTALCNAATFLAYALLAQNMFLTADVAQSSAGSVSIAMGVLVLAAMAVMGI